MGKSSKQAFTILSSYLKTHLDSLPSDETARINAAIVHDLLGEAGPSYRPMPQDTRRSALLGCLIEIIIHVHYLHYHAVMVRRNPYKGKIPDVDYINIVVHSFDETCYIVHERLFKMLNLLKKMQAASKQLIVVSEVIFKDEKKMGTKNTTIFNKVLSARGVHVHNANVERAAVPRLGLLDLFTKLPDMNIELRKFVASELRSQLKASRGKNRERFASSIELVELAVESFFEAVLPELKRLFVVQVQKAER